MKTRNIFYTGVLVAVMLPAFTACEPNMDLVNPSSPTEDGYFNTKDHLISSATSCYNILQILQFWGRNMPYMTNVISDEALTTPNADGDAENKEWSGYNYQGKGMTREIWQNIYLLQYIANLAIEKLSTEEAKALFGADVATLNRSLGEAYFFRAFSAYLSVFYYGDAIPYRDYPAKGSASDSYEAARQPGEIYGYMIADLQKSADLLPGRTELYADSKNQGRIAKGAPQALLAKIYLGRPLFDSSIGAVAEWALAKAELKKIIDSNDYGLVDCYRDNGREFNENNKESIFEVQFLYGADRNGGIPSDNLNGGQFSWRRIGFTVGSEVTGYWYNVMPSLILYNEFERDASGKIIDARAYQGLWIPDGAKYFKDGVAYPYEVAYKYKNSSEALGRYFGTRKMGIDDDTNMTENQRGPCDDRILRYADVLLMYAECCIHDGDENTAKTYLDMIRNRANNQVLTNSPSDAGLFYTTGRGTLPTVDQLIAAKPVVGRVVNKHGEVLLPGVTLDNVEKVLRHEYSCEMFLEGWRMYNVRRWYMNGDQSAIQGMVQKWKVQEEQTGGTFALPFDYKKNSILPIPDDELINNPNMKPNSANK